MNILTVFPAGGDNRGCVHGGGRVAGEEHCPRGVCGQPGTGYDVLLQAGVATRQ